MTNTIEINLRFFASLREKLDCAEQTITVTPEIKTVGQVRQYLIDRGGVWAEALAYDRQLRMAYQQVMCDESAPLNWSNESHEVAFFPPVTGG